MRKSWTRTASGFSCGRYSRPLLRKSPTSSFFLVSTEITGCFSANAAATLGVDAGELRIPVGVAVALFGFAVGLQAVARRIEQFGHQGAAHLVALRLQRLRQPAHAPAGPPQRRFRIPAGRWFDQRLEIRQQGRVPRFREGRLLQIAGLRPAPGRPTRADGSACANSFRPRPIGLGTMPVAIATAAMPPYPAANASAAATRRRPRSSRNGATVKNRSRMGSTSITTTIYGMKRRL